MKISAAYTTHLESIHTPVSVGPAIRAILKRINRASDRRHSAATRTGDIQRSRFRAVDYPTFQNHINRLDIGRITRVTGTTRLYDKNRRLVAALILPCFDAKEATPEPAYYLCNQQPHRTSPLLLACSSTMQLIADLASRSVNRLKQLRPANMPVRQASRLPSQIPAPRSRPRQTAMVTPDAPVWHTLRLTA